MDITKSLYTRGIQCPKSLWLKKYKSDVLTPPDESAQAVFDTGNVVGDLACEIFPNGKEVPFSNNYDEMIAQTQKWIDEGVSNIYEATFNYNGILVMVDILHAPRATARKYSWGVEPEGVEIYEVKSSTSVKDIYLHDVSIQYYVLQKLGFHIKSAHVVHIDKTYIRGDELELDGLFSIVDVTEEVVALQENIPRILEEFENHLSNKENEPDIEIGKHCHNPYECDAKNYCWRVQRGIPDFSIFNIFNLGSKKQIELYEQGIVDIDDVPDSFTMTANQKQAVENYKSTQTHINEEAIKAFVDTLTYPLYHLDFETFQQAVPEFKGISPFMQIPFQYSLHVEHADGSLEHKEFLAQAGSDPRRALAEQLVRDIPLQVSVLTYNMSFEKGVILKLAESFQDLHVRLMAIHDNIHDLMTPFQQKHYVTPEMQGSYSIKYVLPALVPEMEHAYKQLEGVQNGSDAMNAFATLHVKSLQEQTRVRTQLLKYCELDTLAMVKVLGKLKEMSKPFTT